MSSTEVGNRKCKDCGEEKPLTDFYKKAEYGYWFSSCKECFKLQVKARKKLRHKRKYDHRKINTGNRNKAKLLAFWQSIPAAVKDNEYFNRVKNVKITEKEESLVPELLAAKNITDIAGILDVDISTVRRWQKTSFVKRYTEKFDSWNNVLRFKKDVDYAFTQKTIQFADQARVKLWYQLYVGWMERTGNIHEYDEKNILTIQQSLKELGKKPEEEPIKFFIDDNTGDYEESGSDAAGPGEGERDSEDSL